MAGAVGSGQERNPGGRAPGAAAGSVGVAEAPCQGGLEPKPSCCPRPPPWHSEQGLGLWLPRCLLTAPSPPSASSSPCACREHGHARGCPRRATGLSPTPRAGSAHGTSNGKSKNGLARAPGSRHGPSMGSVCAHICCLPVADLAPRWGFTAPGALGDGEVARCPLPPPPFLCFPVAAMLSWARVFPLAPCPLP